MASDLLSLHTVAAWQVSQLYLFVPWSVEQPIECASFSCMLSSCRAIPLIVTAYVTWIGSLLESFREAKTIFHAKTPAMNETVNAGGDAMINYSEVTYLQLIHLLKSSHIADHLLLCVGLAVF